MMHLSSKQKARAVAFCLGLSLIFGTCSESQAEIDFVPDTGTVTSSVSAPVAVPVYGGYAKGGAEAVEVSAKSLTIGQGGAAEENVYGGYANSETGSAASKSNAVAVADGGSAAKVVHGGFAQSMSGKAAASGNAVTVSGSVTSVVCGGSAASVRNDAASEGNAVNVEKGGFVTGSVYGGHVQSVTGKTTASGNTVTISGTVAQTPPIDESSVVPADSVYGGHANGAEASIANGNTVTVSGTAEVAVYGGRANGAEAGIVNGNTVTVSGTVASIVCGGDAYSGSGKAEASGNTVTIRGAVAEDIYGGYAQSASGTATASGNSVVLERGADTPNSTIRGGYAENGESRDNTLEVRALGLKAKDIDCFQNYRFVTDADVKHGDTFLTLTDGSATDISGGVASPEVTMELAGHVSLDEGDEVHLVKADQTLEGGETVDGRKLQADIGATLQGEFQIKSTETGILVTMTDKKAAPGAKALAESALGGMALSLHGADLAAGKGMDSALRAADSAEAPIATFATVSGGTSRYDTGSHVDVDSFALMTGVVAQAATDLGKVTGGAFFEYGNGAYDTHNSFSGAASVDGEGDNHYFGGGLLGRIDFAPLRCGRFYTEASLRLGTLHNEWDSRDLRDGLGAHAAYETDSLYYGAHLGAGFVWNVCNALSLDVYGKYLWTHMEDEKADLATGEKMRFDDVDSHRLRAGLRLTWNVSDFVEPYIGLSCDYELDGEAGATSNGVALDRTDMGGTTGIGEIGFIWKPSAELPLSLDLGVQGYTGVREGVSGTLQFLWKF